MFCNLPRFVTRCWIDSQSNKKTGVRLIAGRVDTTRWSTLVNDSRRLGDGERKYCTMGQVRRKGLTK